jgi:Fe-Mn family superoxide dismutase
MYKLLPLPYNYSDLEPYIDSKTMNIHYNKHYKTYLKNLNEEFIKKNLAFIPIQELIVNIDRYSDNVRNNAGGYYNHSLFWQMLFPSKKGKNNLPYGISKKLIERDFRGLENFKKVIAETAKKRFGSGWVWWIVMPNGKTRVVETPYQDNPKMYYNCDIILGIDVWEHAYYLKYNADRLDYVENIFSVLNWNYANKVLNGYYI